METTNLDKIKEIYAGRKIRINKMGVESRADHYNGKEGIVTSIDDMGLLHGTWGGIGLATDEDDIEVLPTGVGKVYHFHFNVGKAKYIIDFHDGTKVHNDGSAFYDISIFSNKKKMDKFEKELIAKGYEHKPFGWNK